jgi:hypothetical protein
MAANVWLEANAPQLLYRGNPLVEEAMQMMAQAQQAAAEAEMQKKSMESDQKMKEKMVDNVMKTKSDIAVANAKAAGSASEGGSGP